MLKNRTISGFTLVELVVVTSIVSLLSSIVLTVFTSPRQRANDASRVLSIKQLQNALDLYYADHQSYPDTHAALSYCPTSAGNLSLCPPYNPQFAATPTNTQTDWDPASPLQQLVTGRYISKLPVDPLNRDGYWFVYRGTPTGYVLEAPLENGKGVVLIGGQSGVVSWLNVSNTGVVSSLDSRLVARACTAVTPSPTVCATLRDYNCDAAYTSTDLDVLENLNSRTISISQICKQD